MGKRLRVWMTTAHCQDSEYRTFFPCIGSGVLTEFGGVLSGLQSILELPDHPGQYTHFIFEVSAWK
jgi:hypothetical protein